MKFIYKYTVLVLVSCSLLACQHQPTAKVDKTPPTNTPEKTAKGPPSVQKIQVDTGTNTFLATPENNDATTAFIQAIQARPLSISMHDYSGFEKVGSLPTPLPARDQTMTTQAGDIVLYNNNQIVAFYGTHTWSYTKLATIDDTSLWSASLGQGDVTLTFSIPNHN